MADETSLELLNAAAWRQVNVRDERGILIASDSFCEDWIKWWYFNFAKWNIKPIAVVNLGMTKPVLKWCHEKFEVIDLNLPEKLLEKRLQHIDKVKIEMQRFGRNQWRAWFLKPFALLNSPFNQTLWLDLDCLIRGSVDPLFEYPKEPYHVAMAMDESKSRIKEKIARKILKPGEINYNSGVIAYRHGSPLILKWAQATIAREEYFIGDQDIFSRVVGDLGIEIPVLPKKYNWMVDSYGFKKEAVITHFSGKSKDLGLILLKDFYRLAANFRETL